MRRSEGIGQRATVPSDPEHQRPPHQASLLFLGEILRESSAISVSRSGPFCSATSLFLLTLLDLLRRLWFKAP